MVFAVAENLSAVDQRPALLVYMRAQGLRFRLVFFLNADFLKAGRADAFFPGLFVLPLQLLFGIRAAQFAGEFLERIRQAAIGLTGHQRLKLLMRDVHAIALIDAARTSGLGGFRRLLRFDALTLGASGNVPAKIRFVIVLQVVSSCQFRLLNDGGNIRSTCGIVISRS